MLQKIRGFIDRLDRRADGETAQVAPGALDELQLAAAALMVEQARMDNELDDHERERIADLVRWRFDLGAEEADSMVEAAEELADQSSQLYGLTLKIKNAYSYDERVGLIELLWDVAYADGELHAMEAGLMRRIAGLLYVDDRDSGKARKRVLDRYGLTDSA